MTCGIQLANRVLRTGGPRKSADEAPHHINSPRRERRGIARLGKGMFAF